MKYYVNDNLIDINFKSSFIGGGTEAKVYSYGDCVLKLYKNIPNVFVKETKHTLASLPTKRIIMPIDFVYDEKEIERGYTSKYIRKRRDSNSSISTCVLYDNLILLKQDLELLTKNNINAVDCHIDNIIFDKDGNLFIVDIGQFCSSYFKNGAKMVNGITFNYIIKCIIKDTLSSTYRVIYDRNHNIKSVIVGSTYVSMAYINNFLSERIKDKGLNFFEKNVLKCDTLGEYHTKLVKRLTR